MDHDFTKDYQDAVQTVRKRRRKKSTSIGRKFKGAAKSRLRLQEANKLLSRDIPNPFLHMNIEELKQHAISLCYRQIKEQMGKGMSYTESRGGAVRDVATIVCVDRSRIFKWLHELDTVGELSRSKRGRHSKAITPIVNPQFRQKFCDYVRANAHQQGEPNLTTQALAEWVNEILSLAGDNKYSSETIRRWLHDCGFQVGTIGILIVMIFYPTFSFSIESCIFETDFPLGSIKTSQELRMLSRSLSECKPLTLSVMIQVSQFVSNSQLCHKVTNSLNHSQSKSKSESLSL